MLINYPLLILLFFAPAKSQDLPQTVLTSSTANIYKAPSRQSGRLHTVRRGTELNLIEVITTKHGDHWFKIEFAGKIGWISDYFIFDGQSYLSESEIEEAENKRLEEAENERLANYEFAFYSKTTNDLNPLSSGAIFVPSKELTGPIKTVATFRAILTNKFGEYVLGETIFIDSLSFDRHRKLVFKRKHISHNDRRFVEYRFVHDSENKIIEAHISSPYEVHWSGAYQIEGQFDSIWTLGAQDQRGASLIQKYRRGDLSERKFIDKDGQITAFVRKYSDGPRRYKTTIYDSTGAISSVSIDSTDSLGREIGSWSYGSNGVLWSSSSNEYLENGITKSENIDYDSEGKQDGKTSIVTDHSGLTVKLSVKYDSKYLQSLNGEFVYDYELDHFGNWITKTKKRKLDAFGSTSFVPIEVTSRSINYYDD